MSEAVRAFVANRFSEEHGARPCMDYGEWHVVSSAADQPMAALAVRCAADEPLFLEAYLSSPIEMIVSAAFDRGIARNAIVEIGCLAAVPTPAIVKLWSDAASTLAGRHEVAVATLTLPLRKMFARIGLPFVELAQADPSRLQGRAHENWGRYYDAHPVVCAGDIRNGSAALTAFNQRGAA